MRGQNIYLCDLSVSNGVMFTCNVECCVFMLTNQMTPGHCHYPDGGGGHHHYHPPCLISPNINIQLDSITTRQGLVSTSPLGTQVEECKTFELRKVWQWIRTKHLHK